MRLGFTDSYLRDYRRLPPEVQRHADQRLDRLLENPRHPSLRMKKMRGTRTLWEVSVTMSYRITFEIRDDTYHLRRVGTHDILRTP